MVAKCIINGVRVHGPPYTKAEEEDFYKRNGGGPVAMTSITRGRPKEAPTKPASKPTAKKRRSDR